MPVLHHHPLSAGSRYVRLVLAEYGETATLVDELPWERREEFLALNPAGTLPVLVDDNETVSPARRSSPSIFSRRAARGPQRPR
jgi:glutathione S-transferase